MDSWLFCEICMTNFRQFLVRFEDGSLFTLCKDCVDDLVIVIETFNVDCSIEAFAERTVKS